jgi:hypothetical protein
VKDIPTRGSLGSLEGWGRSRSPFFDRLPSTSSMSESSCTVFSCISGCLLGSRSAASDIFTMLCGHKAMDELEQAIFFIYAGKKKKDRAQPRNEDCKLNQPKVQRSSKPCIRMHSSTCKWIKVTSYRLHG